MENAITCAPGNNASANIVMFYSSEVPHFVRQGSKGQYLCDYKCINWATSGVYSHSIAVAELNHDLDKSLLWYNSGAPEPNITSLAFTGLPSGRGTKGGTARQKCIMKGKTPIECVKQRQATVCPTFVDVALVNIVVTSSFKPKNTNTSFIQSTPSPIIIEPCALGANPSFIQLQVPQIVIGSEKTTFMAQNKKNHIFYVELKLQVCSLFCSCFRRIARSVS